MNSNFELVTLKRKGETTLHGAKVGTGEILVVHIHGSWGNFYENPFALGLAQKYHQAGYAYASINDPGHDGGTIDEAFDESVDAVKDWCNFLAGDEGKIILQGHSLGALKIMRLASNPEHAEFFERVVGIVLLSPFDVASFYGGRNSERRREHAKEFRDSFGENAILPNSIFDTWPISAGTFLELSEQGSEYDLFPSRKKEIGILAKLTIPALVVLGEEDIASDPTAKDVMAALEIGKCQSEMIKDSPHNFAGFEDELYRIVSDFISKFGN